MDSVEVALHHVALSLILLLKSIYWGKEEMLNILASLSTNSTLCPLQILKYIGIKVTQCAGWKMSWQVTACACRQGALMSRTLEANWGLPDRGLGSRQGKTGGQKTLLWKQNGAWWSFCISNYEEESKLNFKEVFKTQKGGWLPQ